MELRLQAAKALAVLAVLAVFASFFTHVHASGEAHCYKSAPKPWVCLTVDDGFNTQCIKSMLKTLRKYNVKCTFFVVGAYLTKRDNQPLWRQAIQDGHEICYHTMRHQRVTNLNKSQINADITAWEKAAHMVLGDTYNIPKFARLPGGAGSYNPKVLRIFSDRGYTVIRWNVDTLTGPKNHKLSIKRYVMRYTGKGAIILTHFSGGDAGALPGYIGWLKKNYKLGRISDAFAPKPTPTPSPLAAAPEFIPTMPPYYYYSFFR